MKSDREIAFISREFVMFCKNRNIETEHSPPKIHIGKGAVKGVIQTLKNPIVAKLEDKIEPTEGINRACVLRHIPDLK